MILMVLLLNVIVYSQKEYKMDVEKAKEEVWNTVLAHNKAWSQMENLDEQALYVHNEIVFISPPYLTPIVGKEEYLKGYQEWFDNATVHYFKEGEQQITFHCSGKFALVTFKIDMSFDYYDQRVDKWQGIDMMTLVFENGKWLIASDMYAKEDYDEI